MQRLIIPVMLLLSACNSQRKEQLTAKADSLQKQILLNREMRRDYEKSTAFYRGAQVSERVDYYNRLTDSAKQEYTRLTKELALVQQKLKE